MLKKNQQYKDIAAAYMKLIKPKKSIHGQSNMRMSQDSNRLSKISGKSMNPYRSLMVCIKYFY